MSRTSGSVLRRWRRPLFILGILAAGCQTAPATAPRPPLREAAPAPFSLSPDADGRVQEIGLSPLRFVARTAPVGIGRHTLQLDRGVFSFRPSLRFLHPPEGPRATGGRKLIAIGAEVEAGHAYSDPVRIPGTWLTAEKITTRRIGRTAIRFRAIEIREDDRTLALIETDDLLRPPRERRFFGLDERIDDWSRLRVLYHIRIMMENDQGEIVPIPELETPDRLIEWRPGAFGFELRPAAAIGRPPRPAEVRPIGAGLVILPGETEIGETFTAHVIFQNQGDRPSSPLPLQWRYGPTTRAETLPALAPGAMADRRFLHVAKRDYDRVELLVGERRHEAGFIPLALPRLKLGEARRRPGYAAEPLEIEFEVENVGHGTASAATLRLDDGDGRETSISLPPLAPGERATWRARWDAELADSFSLGLALASGAGDETARTLRIERRARPRPRIALERVAFATEERAAAPLTLVAALRNTGELAGTASLQLAIIHRPSGRILLEQTWSGRVAADSRIEIASEAIPREPGILLGRARLDDGAEEFVLIDLAPPPTPTGGDEAIRRPLTRGDRMATGLAVNRVERGMLWLAAPLLDPEEVDATPLLSLALLSWRRAADGAWSAAPGRENRPVARLTIGDGETRERFDLVGGETDFVLPLARAALAETLSVRLEPLDEARVFLTGPPTLIFSPTAAENGAIIEAAERGGSIWTRIANRGRLIEADAITLAAAVEGAEYHRLVIPLPPGAETVVKLPPPPGAPGRRAVTLSLPRSVRPLGPALRVLTPPDPLPELWVGAPRWGSTSGDAADVVFLALEVATAAAPGLTLEALPESGDALARLHLRLTAPAGETVIFVTPPAARLRLDYGPMMIDRRVPPRPLETTGRRLRIVDLGGDTPAADRELVLRYERRGLDRALPAGTVKLAVNGLLRAARAVPALETGQIFFGGIVFLPGPAEEQRLDLILFEETGETCLALSLHSVATVVSSPAPTRADRGWFSPVVIDGRRWNAVETGSIYLRLAERAWAVSGFLARRDGTFEPPITPEAARRLDRLAGETDVLARIAYREALDVLSREWRLAAILLGGASLPVTAETRHLAELFAALDRLETLAADPAVIERLRVEETLERMTRPIDLLIGRIVE